jgi:hypothetical protein
MATKSLIGYGIAVLAIAKGEPVPTLATPLPESPPRTPKRAKPPLRSDHDGRIQAHHNYLYFRHYRLVEEAGPEPAKVSASVF